MVVRARPWARLPALVWALALVPALACSAETRTAERVDDEISGAPLTEIERASIGSVWLYAHASWTTALNAKAVPSGRPLTPSPAYLAYWHWFDQIATGAGARIQTGGNWKLASSIALRFGVCPEADFAAEDPSLDAAARFDAARAILDASLATGILHDPAKRRDRRVVRAELDRAFRVPAATRAVLDQVFGEDVSRAFSATAVRADPTGTPILRAEDVPVAYPERAGAVREQTLATAMASWRSVYASATEPAAALTRVERAMEDGAPVLLTWFVDFGALEDRDRPLRGTFNLGTLRELGPRQQGGHTAVLEASSASLVRVPNAWGAAHPERVSEPGMPAHHDVLVEYLVAPIKRCVTRDGVTDTSNCPTTQVPLESVVLPPGY